MTYEPHELYEELVIPAKEIAAVIDWIKAEQVRVIQKDRTIHYNKIVKLDWLTETIDNLGTLREHAEKDAGEVSSTNRWRERNNKQQASYADCSCRPGCSCKKLEAF